MSSNLLFDLELAVYLISRQLGFCIARDLQLQTYFWFFNQKENGITPPKLRELTKVSAIFTMLFLKPSTIKVLVHLVRPTLVSVQHGLIEAWNTVLIGLLYASQRFIPLSPP
jgi:hypothetical protein